MKLRTRLRQALILSLALLASWLTPLFGFRGMELTASALSTDYPVQLMNISTKDASLVLTENGTADGASLSVKALGSDLSCSWRFDRVGADSNGTFFKLVNAQSGRLLTPQGYNVTAGANVIMYGSESAQSQHWYVVPVSQDHLGNDLCYKIVNYSDTSLALTQGTSGMTLASYSGADSQLWTLNCDGLQGFAGYCSDDDPLASGSTVKAGDIGGLFGETVEVTSFDDLKKYAESTTPYTIVVTANISLNSFSTDSLGQKYTAPGRIQVASKKTIIGSYNAHTLNNVAFTTEQSDKGNGSNVIIKNFDIQHSAEANGNDNIMVYFRGGQNLWVDHLTFTGHSGYNPYGTDNSVSDKDKFLACCYYADYCTVSECSFGLHEYGLILGYPDSSASNYSKYNGFPRMTIAANKFDKTLTRAPGLMRWGYYHSLNNYVNSFSMAYTVQANCNIFTENCYYANGGNVCCDWNQAGANDQNLGYFLDSGSATDGTAKRLYAGDGTASNPSYAQTGTWKANSNYTYIRKNASEVAGYTTSYSGCQSSKDSMMYLRYGTKGVPASAYTEAPSGPVAAEFTNGSTYMIKNVNSGLYMEVANAAAENSANVQQWGQDAPAAHNVWKLVSAGDGYYYLYSALGGGDAYVLDVAGKKADNGTNIDIYQFNGGTNQQFMLTANGDGSYKIRTRVSGENSAVEIKDGLTSSGANVQEWEVNGANCQDWILEPARLPLNGVLVKELTVSDETTADKWSIGYNAAVGSTIFGDRDFTYTQLPDALTGAEQILTACDSKYTDSDLATFTAGDDIYVFVLMDTRVTAAPAWLSDYDPTGLTAETSNDVTMMIYARSVDKGEKVNLGTNGQSANCVNYSVLVIKDDRSPLIHDLVPGDVNMDYEFNIADVVAMQKWLLGQPDHGIKNWELGDLDQNGVLDILDLCLMRQLLTEKPIM
ncbi:MAG: RICIN domain-containing protein [Ruminococcus sp.]|nr:RICIN domain-containing protein [Ruminococcus sp.]